MHRSLQIVPAINLIPAEFYDPKMRAAARTLCLHSVRRRFPRNRRSISEGRTMRTLTETDLCKA